MGIGNKLWIAGVVSIMGILGATLVYATSWQVHGAHYNLNIIGAKNVGDIGDSNGHTMFVKLNGKTKITMTQNPEGLFRVTDRNGLDGEAEFNIAPGHYNVYAIARGKPGGNVKITASGEFEDAIAGTKIIPLGYVDLTRSKGKPQSVNINELFYVDVTICTLGDNGSCIQETVYQDYWVFDIAELLSYWWDYDNAGLKNLQIRFYECTLDASGEANDYCRWADGTPIDSQKTIIDLA